MQKVNYYLLVLSLFVSFTVLAYQNDTPVSGNQVCILYEYDINSDHNLSEEERTGLIHMRIEEKLARDVYTVMGDLWNHRSFLNIKLSERRHMDAVKSLLDKYDVPDPIKNDSVGVFPDAEFQQMYDVFIRQGKSSLKEALLVGKSIEELDIADLEEQLGFADNPDIIRVYQNLKAASERHLAAFLRCMCTSAAE
jgi:hypothetical protein